MKKVFALKKICFAVLAVVSMACAAPYTHDGFYMNSAIGVGYFGFDYSQSKTIGGRNYALDLDYGGSGVDFDFKIGARVYGNFLLHITFSTIMKRGSADIETSIDGELVEKFKDSGMMQVDFFGVGGTYYLPNNMFVTSSVGGAFYSLGSQDFDDCDDDFGFQVGVGKEWWVSPEWGFGVEVVFTHTSGNQESLSEFRNPLVEKLTTNTLMVLFSTTFN